jgi:hypothetical protein
MNGVARNDANLSEGTIDMTIRAQDSADLNGHAATQTESVNSGSHPTEFE